MALAFRQNMAAGHRSSSGLSSISRRVTSPDAPDPVPMIPSRQRCCRRPAYTRLCLKKEIIESTLRQNSHVNNHYCLSFPRGLELCNFLTLNSYERQSVPLPFAMVESLFPKYLHTIGMREHSRPESTYRSHQHQPPEENPIKLSG
jgi:hypothetical protein